MSNVPRSNPELEAAINGAQTPQELREAMLSTLAKQGQIVRTRDDEFNNRLIQRPNTDSSPLPANGYRFERVLRFDPESGKRALVLRANTVEDLNALEAQILKY